MRPGNGPYSNRGDYYGKLKVTVNISPQLHGRLVFCAAKENLNRHAFMLKILEEGIVRREENVNRNYGTDTYNVERELKAKQE